MRVAGNKQKTEMLYNELEQNFYSKHEKVSGILKKAGVHDLSALLKRWLRELPTPLLANDLVHLFYQTAGAFNFSFGKQYKFVNLNTNLDMFIF